jgi:hypothetical protein
LPKAVAQFGIAVGLCLLIVPGLLAIRSYRRWQDGEAPQPALAWALAVLGPGLVLTWAGLRLTDVDFGIVVVAILVIPSAIAWLLHP